jgi:hypothetical protein
MLILSFNADHNFNYDIHKTDPPLHLLLLPMLSDIHKSENIRGRCGRDRMVVGFTITCAISDYHH